MEKEKTIREKENSFSYADIINIFIKNGK